jgi:glucose-6-phosphate isomerase
MVILSLFHDNPSSEPYYKTFAKEKVLENLRALDERIRSDGLEALDPNDPLVAIGTERDAKGRITKSCYGVLNLSWQSQQHPEWAEMVSEEVREIGRRIREAHDVPLRFLIWAGMGGSAEDKSMYNSVGLLRRGARCYVLDSTDPVKLKHILGDMRRRSGASLAETLRGTLVVGMAMGMTSYEPVVNLEKLASLYDRHRIDSTANFLYMTLPGSLLDQFASKRGYRRVELQPDNANTTAGRHSAPLTRGSLYPLALARVDLRTWIQGAALSTEDIQTAWRLASFLHAQGEKGRDKVTLLMPKAWNGACVWTKQDFEESLGKSEQLGIKIVIQEKHKLADYRAPKDPLQDRAFFAVQIRGGSDAGARKINLLRRAGYPLAVLTVPRESSLSRYMQFVHYTVFGVAYLRRMNFVTQPGVELYKSITNRLHAEAQKAGGIEHTKPWRDIESSPHRLVWGRSVTLHLGRLRAAVPCEETEAPRLYASLLKRMSSTRSIEYAELTFFGDTRYSPGGRQVRRCLDRAAGELFRARLKMPVDVYEGPAMNHSYHEMIIGHGRCLSTVLLCEKAEEIPAAGYTADYHRAQFLATQMALAEKGRAVVAITLKDLEPETVETLGRFFHQAALSVKSGRI